MDITDYDDLRWFCFFLSLLWFRLLLFMQGSRVIEFFGAWHWNFGRAFLNSWRKWVQRIWFDKRTRRTSAVYGGTADGVQKEAKYHGFVG